MCGGVGMEGGRGGEEEREGGTGGKILKGNERNINPITAMMTFENDQYNCEV